MIIVHLDLVHYGLAHHAATHEWHLLKVQDYLSFLHGLLLRLEFPQVSMSVSAVDLECVGDLLVIDLLRVFLVPQEIDVLTVFLRDALDLGVGAPEYMLPPIIVVEGYQFDPAIEVLIFLLDDPLLPFLVMADVIIRIETVVPMMLGVLISLAGKVCLKGG